MNKVKGKVIGLSICMFVGCIFCCVTSGVAIVMFSLNWSFTCAFSMCAAFKTDRFYDPVNQENFTIIGL